MPMKDSGIQSFDFFVQMHITERCNLACTHCYQEGRSMRELSFDDIKKAVKHIADTIDAWSDTYDIPFAPSFNVTGGEPLLRDDLGDILRVISDQGFDIFLLTNGILIDGPIAEMLAGVPIRGVQVSLEGPEDIHDIIRGKGSFSSALRGVHHLLDAGTIVTLNMTLSELNAEHLPELITLAEDLGVQRIGFSRLVPYGRGFSLVGKMLDKTRLERIYRNVLSYRSPSLEIATGDPVAAQLRAGDDIDLKPDAHPLGGCAAGISGITILPDGTLTPCRRLGKPIGNIMTDSLREVWANSDILNALRTREMYRGKCRDCARWPQCRGCRAIAYAYALSQGSDDFLSEDPQCFIEDYKG
ncbi:MAG: radical SAM protein [Syntrophorhabdus sp.]